MKRLRQPWQPCNFRVGQGIVSFHLVRIERTQPWRLPNVNYLCSECNNSSGVLKPIVLIEVISWPYIRYVSAKKKQLWNCLNGQVTCFNWVTGSTWSTFTNKILFKILGTGQSTPLDANLWTARRVWTHLKFSPSRPLPRPRRRGRVKKASGQSATGKLATGELHPVQVTTREQIREIGGRCRLQVMHD